VDRHRERRTLTLISTMPYTSDYRRRVGYNPTVVEADPSWVKLPRLEPYGDAEKQVMKDLKRSHGIKFCHYGDREKQGWYAGPLLHEEVISLMPEGRPIPKDEWTAISYGAVDALKALGYDKPDLSWRPIINPKIVSDPRVATILESISV
jgi:hypothetical protein